MLPYLLPRYDAFAPRRLAAGFPEPMAVEPLLRCQFAVASENLRHLPGRPLRSWQYNSALPKKPTLPRYIKGSVLMA